MKTIEQLKKEVIEECNRCALKNRPCKGCPLDTDEGIDKEVYIRWRLQSARAKLMWG